MPSKKIFLWLLLTGLSYAGCKNTNSDNNKYSAADNTFRSAWYKHYNGTKNGQPVAVDLQYSGKTLRGSYYYIDTGIIIDLLPTDQNAASPANIILAENIPGNWPNDDDSSTKAIWRLSMQETGATGKCTSGNSSRGDITLREDYPVGTCPLRIWSKSDSKEERKDVMHVTATTLYELLQPSTQMNNADADFLRMAIQHFLGGDFVDAPNINDYVLQEDKKYFDNFEKLLPDMKIDREAHEDWQYNFERKRRMSVRFNSGGMLVLQLEESDRTGGSIMGSHTRTRYACIDVAQKKVWQANDIMALDAAKVTPLLNNAARKIFHENSALAESQQPDNIPLTDNVFFTTAGITYCYYPGVIAPEDVGEIYLFIPYSQLKNCLKNEFIKRMNL
jgi:hypothetical protein